MNHTYSSADHAHFHLSILAVTPYKQAELADLDNRFRAAGAEFFYELEKPFQPAECGPVQHPLNASVVTSAENYGRLRETINSVERIPGWDVRW